MGVFTLSIPRLVHPKPLWANLIRISSRDSQRLQETTHTPLGTMTRFEKLPAIPRNSRTSAPNLLYGTLTTAFRPAFASTASQPKGVAVSLDGTAFVAEVSSVEAFKSNQRVAEISTKYAPHSIAVSKTTVAVGGDVGLSFTHHVRENDSSVECKGLPL